MVKQRCQALSLSSSLPFLPSFLPLVTIWHSLLLLCMIRLPLLLLLLLGHQQDEVLSHRLGLVPLSVDPDRLAWRSVEDPVTESNTVVFKLDITCRRDEDGSLVNDKGEQAGFDRGFCGLGFRRVQNPALGPVELCHCLPLFLGSFPICLRAMHSCAALCFAVLCCAVLCVVQCCRRTCCGCHRAVKCLRRLAAGMVGCRGGVVVGFPER